MTTKVAARMTWRERPRSRMLLTVSAVAVLVVAAGCAVGDSTSSADAESFPNRTIEILAPGATGGGWDARARSIQSGFADCGITDADVTVTNTPGAGGTIGLADFVTHNGDPYQWMVMDTVTMLGGIVRNDSPVDLTTLTPIAGLTGSTDLLVVPAASPYQTFDDLVASFRQAPAELAWTGGSLGGPDHMSVGLLAKKLGISIGDVNYVATAGGGEVLSLLLSGSADAGFVGSNEATAQVQAGELRALAVSGKERLAGIDAPTLTELSMADINVTSIGGIMAPPGISDADAASIIDMITRLRDTECWHQALERNDWTDDFTTGEAFGAVIADQKGKVDSILNELGLVE